MKLNELKPAEGSTHRVKRLGRGDASGHGGTSTKGHKGQKSRSGGYHKRGFEGGQMPLQRRIPKSGFTNIFRREYTIINVGRLSVFPMGTEITPELLLEKGFVRNFGNGLKILAGGKLEHALTIKGFTLSKQAKAKIEASGGKVV
jgi:large subunit ribosomal protein L15